MNELINNTGVWSWVSWHNKIKRCVDTCWTVRKQHIMIIPMKGQYVLDSTNAAFAKRAKSADTPGCLDSYFLSTHCWVCASASLLNIQYFVTCNSCWHKSVASRRVDWIIHSGSVAHSALLPNPARDTVTALTQNNNMYEAGLEGEGQWEYGHEWVAEEKHMNEK